MSPSGTSKSSRSKNEDNVRARELHDLPRSLTQEEYEAPAEEERILYQRGADAVSTPLPASADPTNPLFGSPAIIGALAEIDSAAPTSRTRPNEAGPSLPRCIATGLRVMVTTSTTEQVEATRKAEADRVAATGLATGSRQEQGHQNASVDSATDSEKKAEADHPVPSLRAMDGDTTEAEPSRDRPKTSGNIWDIWQPLKIRCAARIGTSEDEIMGNPFSQTPGWDLKVALNAGKSTTPFIHLKFKVAKDGIDSEQADHYNYFTMGWEPGFHVGDEWMMEDLHVERVVRPSNPNLKDRIFPPALQELCKTKGEAKRLVCVSFRSNALKISPVDTNCVKVLGDDYVAPFKNLQRMLEPSYMVTLWFMSPHQEPKYFYRGCLFPLVHAMKHPKPRFYLYIHENNERMMSLSAEILNLKEENASLRNSESNILDDADALRAENLELKAQVDSLQRTLESNPTPDSVDALRAENLKLKEENASQQTSMRDQDERIRTLAEDLRKAHKQLDEIFPVAEKRKHQHEVKPKELQKTLNAISKIRG